MQRPLLISLIVAAFSSVALAETATVNPTLHSGGLAYRFKNIIFYPSAQPLPLPNKELSSRDKAVVDNAEKLVNNNKATALLLIENGKIVFEKYKEPAAQDSPLFSQSMSKSLTAYAFGAVMCSGKIHSLDDRADKYAQTLKGTIFGEAKIRNLLRMSSGTTTPTLAGSHDPKEWFNLRDGVLTTVDILHGQANTRENPQGIVFNYSSTDTWSLQEVAQGAGETIEEAFRKEIWAKAHTESEGYWLHDKSGRLLVQSGFSATARDWARLAIYTIKTLQGENGACMQGYMEKATSKQIANKSNRVGLAFPEYGFQTWIADFSGKKSYWWVGYGGQRVAIDPNSEKIMVLTSWKEDYMREVYNLFIKWQ